MVNYEIALKGPMIFSHLEAQHVLSHRTFHSLKLRGQYTNKNAYQHLE